MKVEYVVVADESAERAGVVCGRAVVCFDDRRWLGGDDRCKNGKKVMFWRWRFASMDVL